MCLGLRGAREWQGLALLGVPFPGQTPDPRPSRPSHSAEVGEGEVGPDMDFEAKGSTETHCGLPVSLSGPTLTLASARPARGGVVGRGGRQSKCRRPTAAPQSTGFFLRAPCGLCLRETGCARTSRISTCAPGLWRGRVEAWACFGVFIDQFEFRIPCFHPLFRKSLSNCISSSYWYILFCVYRDVSYLNLSN